MNATTTPIYAKGDFVKVTLTDGTHIIAEYVGTNDKGVVSLKVEDGKIVTRAASRVVSIELPSEEDDQGYTTAELSEMFDTSARALRRRLRALSMGVGKGRRYHLTDAQLATVRTSIEGEPIED